MADTTTHPSGLLQERLSGYDLPQQFKAQGIYPYFREITGKQGPVVHMEGKEVLMFGSNAYTGLTYDDRVIEAGVEALRKYGSGCAGSRFLNGTLDLHTQRSTNWRTLWGRMRRSASAPASRSMPA